MVAMVSWKLVLFSYQDLFLPWLPPRDTYLDRFRVWDGAVQLQGKSRRAQRLIEIVNESPYFEGAAFRGPTRLDTRSGAEIFDINTDLTLGDGG